MPTPGEHKTVQARILEYAEVIGWTFVSQKEAELLPGGRSEVFRGNIENQKKTTLWPEKDF